MIPIRHDTYWQRFPNLRNVELGEFRMPLLDIPPSIKAVHVRAGTNREVSGRGVPERGDHHRLGACAKNSRSHLIRVVGVGAGNLSTSLRRSPYTFENQSTSSG